VQGNAAFQRVIEDCGGFLAEIKIMGVSSLFGKKAVLYFLPYSTLAVNEGIQVLPISH